MHKRLGHVLEDRRDAGCVNVAALKAELTQRQPSNELHRKRFVVNLDELRDAPRVHALHGFGFLRQVALDVATGKEALQGYGFTVRKARLPNVAVSASPDFPDQLVAHSVPLVCIQRLRW